MVKYYFLGAPFQSRYRGLLKGTYLPEKQDENSWSVKESPCHATTPRKGALDLYSYMGPKFEVSD